MFTSKIYFLSYFLSISLIYFGCSEHNIPTRTGTKVGVIDLTNVSFQDNEIIDLNGEWDFYWKEFYIYEEIINKKVKPSIPFNVPGIWNGMKINEELLTGNGYATFHVLIKVSKESKNLGIRIPIIETANKIWLNEILIYESGKIGKLEEEMTPYLLRSIKPLNLNGQNEFHLTLQVSNFMSRTGGIPGVFLVGSIDTLHHKKFIDLTLDMIILGSLLIMGIYHIGLYLIRRKEKSSLYFGLFCLDFGIRLLITDERVLLTTFPSLPFNLTNRLEFFTAYSMFPLFVAFLYYLFPNKMNPFFLYIVAIFTFFLSTAVLFLSHTIYTELLFIYEITILISMPYLFFVNFIAIKNKLDGALVSIIGVCLLAIGAIIDILQSEHILYGHYVFPFSLFGFLFFQSFSLAIKFSKAFLTSENLTIELVEQKSSLANTNQELSELQLNLEKKVKEKGEALIAIHQKNIFEIKKINSLERELAVQKERQNILTDIHDHMGSNILDLNRILNKITKDNIFPVNDLDNAKLHLKKLEDNLRLKLYSIEDLEIFKKDPINGIRLLILRRYSIYDREINFFCEDNLFDFSLNGLKGNLPEVIFSISQEIANNDLKYGYGLSKWTFFLRKKSLNLEISTHTNYRTENESLGNGKQNISLRLKELNAYAMHCSQNGIFHVRYYFPITNVSSM